ncbi:MAG: helical backbone metal receptor [Ginsengibacter sp.]
MVLSKNNLSSKKYSAIISLVPSQTELLFYLGLEKEVIGITKFCIHPDAWFKEKTRVGGTKNINLETIDQLSPDLIIANKEENSKEQIEKLAVTYDIWITDVKNLPEAIEMIRDIGNLTNRTEAAFDLALKIESGFIELKNIFSKKRRIQSAYFIWKDPYMVAANDTFINDMMKYCGLENIYSNLDRYPQITLKEISDKKCELILLSSEPFPFGQKHKEEIQNQLPGTKIVLVDGEMFSWYGNRLLKSISYFRRFSENL